MKIIYVNWGVKNYNEGRSLQLYTQLLQLRKESLRKIQACTGFEPLTSVIPVQHSTNFHNSKNWLYNCNITVKFLACSRLSDRREEVSERHMKIIMST